jgi:ribosomal protein S18 acetylase RimI-like enzyme
MASGSDFGEITQLARRTYRQDANLITIAGLKISRRQARVGCSPVYQFRQFRNSDPPRLAEIWRDQPPQRGLIQPVSPALLDQFVFSKPYFDPAGLILAIGGEQAVGFVHAGFGPNEAETDIDTEIGTTYQLMLRGESRQDGLADELLARAEAYLRDRGAKVIYAGGIRPLNGFYLGLYGGSELPGVLASDPVLNAAAVRNGYREIDKVIVLQLELAGYRQPFTRTQRQLRREVTFSEAYDPPAISWWDAVTTAGFERLEFYLQKAGRDEPLARVWFWNIEPLSTSWGAPTAGMFDLEVCSDRRRQGLATFLLGEALERLRNRGILRVEAQTMRENSAALALYDKLGFKRVDEGTVYRKEAAT